MSKGPKWHKALRQGLSHSVGGDLMEMGVFRGDTLRLMLEARKEMDRMVDVWAVDSWEGMPTPGPGDNNEYPKGKFGHVDVAEFNRGMAKAGWYAGDYIVVKGFVPEVFVRGPAWPANLRFGFVHVDLDQFQTTIEAARWAWPRILSGGALAFHDWYPGKDKLAAAGISCVLHELCEAAAWGLTVLIEEDELILIKP